LAKSLIISFQYNIELVYFFYSNPLQPSLIVHRYNKYTVVSGIQSNVS